MTPSSAASIIELATVDSTNNHAMSMINADTARHGLTILAQTQTAGKGQRGKAWTDAPGDSLLMSLVAEPRADAEVQFLFSATVATAIANILTALYDGWEVRIKWPNDIIVNDRKAGGILIENVWRGNRWLYSVVGIGINVRQTEFPTHLPNATSLFVASGELFDVKQLAQRIQEALLPATAAIPQPDVMDRYNAYLFRKGQSQMFSNGGNFWQATVERVTDKGQLQVKTSLGETDFYYHGVTDWVWKP